MLAAARAAVVLCALIGSVEGSVHQRKLVYGVLRRYFGWAELPNVLVLAFL